MPGKSGLPVHISAKIHPMLQTSSAVEYFLHVWVFIAFGLGPKCELSTHRVGVRDGVRFTVSQRSNGDCDWGASPRLTKLQPVFVRRLWLKHRPTTQGAGIHHPHQALRYQNKQINNHLKYSHHHATHLEPSTTSGDRYHNVTTS